VDTGATGVAISRQLADELGLESHAAQLTSTANGDTISYQTRLAEVRLGGIVAKDVAASIVPNLDGDVLLGMSFLNRMDIRLYQGTMTIRQGS
jgi:aspartyl protease family protein